MIGVLIATAITGVMVVTILILVDQVSKSISRSNGLDAIESAVRTVQGIIANKDLCDNALRGANSSLRITFNCPPATPNCNPVDVQNIYAQRVNSNSVTSVLRKNQNLGSGITVTSITFSERVDNVGRGTMILNGVTHYTFAGQIALRFGGTSFSQRDRIIPYNAVVSTVDNTIQRCYQDSSVQYMCEQLGGSYDVSNGNCTGLLSATDLPDCQADLAGKPGDCDTTAIPNASCTNLYYLAGFNPGGGGTGNLNATPLCRCQRICIGTGGGGGSAAASGATGATATGSPVGGAVGPATGSGGN